jgi:hypothetical protein
MMCYYLNVHLQGQRVKVACIEHLLLKVFSLELIAGVMFQVCYYYEEVRIRVCPEKNSGVYFI